MSTKISKKEEVKMDKPKKQKVAQEEVKPAPVVEKKVEETAKPVEKKKKTEKKAEPVPVPVAEPVVSSSASSSEVVEKEVSEETESKTPYEQFESSLEDMKKSLTEELAALKEKEPKNTCVKSLKAHLKTVSNLTKLLPKLQKKSKRVPSESSKNNGFNKPIRISPELASFLKLKAEELVPRTEVTRSIWSYVKDNNLKCEDGRKFIPNGPLSKLLGTKEELSLFTLQKLLKQHFPK